MNLTEILGDAKETIGSKGVFGAPFEKNGVTIIPAARIMGGAGAGEGPAKRTADDDVGEEIGSVQTGSGGGFGVSGQPTGAFVIKGDKVTWLPAVDVNRLMFGFQIVMVVFLLAMRSIAKARSGAAIARAAKTIPA
jgi:uncharacterized spore protein YtfJ